MKVKELMRILDMLPANAEVRFARTTLDGHLTSVPIELADVATIPNDNYHCDPDPDKHRGTAFDVVLLS